jgi:peptidoglycan/LPS O-acetylase OafA/YrhL
MPFSRRSSSIDCLRAVSILWVMAYHFLPPTALWVRKGSFGVLLFFVISGYCIANSARSSASAWHFYGRRLARLLPALLFCSLAITWAKHTFPQFAARQLSWFDAFYTLFALPSINVLKVDYFLPDGAYWTLQVEFQFYLLCFVAMLLGLRRHLVAAVAIFVAGRLAWLDPSAYTGNNFFPFFLAGLALAAWFEGRRMVAAFGLACAFGVDACYLARHASEPSLPIEPLRSAMLAAATLAVFLAAKHPSFPPRGEKWLRPLALIGVISFPLYLLHQDLGRMLLAWLQVPRHASWESVVLRVVIILGFFLPSAYAIHRLIELPLMDLLRHPGRLWRRPVAPPGSR